jgi:hypothetical protein
MLKNIFESVLGYVTRERKYWISAPSWEKIKKRREIKEEYSFLDKDIKRSIRRDHRIFLEGMAQRAQEAAEGRYEGTVQHLKEND